MKKEMAPGIKSVLKKYGVKGSISVRHHSSVVVKLSKGKLDLKENPNIYCLDSHYEGEIRDFYKELRDAMSLGYYDNSDPQSDYFDTAFYRHIEVKDNYEFIN